MLVVTPVLRPDLNLLEKSLSYYAIGPWGVLQAIAFGALGISSMALGAALRATIESRWVWLDRPLARTFRALPVSGSSGIRSMRRGR